MSLEGNSLNFEKDDNKSIKIVKGKLSTKEKDKQLWRDLVAFWILGLCNNYGYVVMLSAAHDILKQFGDSSDHDGDKEGFARECNYISTGAILLADILPALFIKIIGPFLPFFVNVRVVICCLLAAAGFLLVAFANAEWIAITGVVFTSLASGLGELTFLSYSSSYNKNVISTWSSGTGGAGIVGSLSYATLTGLGLSATNTLLVMLVVPAAQAISFWIILRHNNKKSSSSSLSSSRRSSGVNNQMILTDSNKAMTINDQEIEKVPNDCETVQPLREEETPLMGIKNKLKYVPSLFKYMIPLTLVYLFEYFINQGLFELVYFPNIWLTKSEQYRWLQVDYQIGVFISRSSVNIIQFNKVWIMAVLQFLNVAFFLFEVVYFFSPSIWLIFAIVFWEGLLGGGAYVNTFYRMSIEVPDARKQFALGVTTMSDSVGIALAGLFAIPSHNALCRLPALR